MCFPFWYGNMRYFKIMQMVDGGEVDGAKCDLRLLLRFVYFRFSKDPSLSYFNVSFEKDPKKDPGGKFSK